MNDFTRESFEEYADSEGFCLDCAFFEEGNNYEDPSTRLAYDIWCKAQAACSKDVKWKHEALITYCKFQDDIIAKQSKTLNLVNLYENKDVWYWQGEEDYLESLCCPVVIHANDLRNLLSENGQ